MSADEIHKIAILDIRLMNADRNAANILCKRHQDDSIELVPIDHGYGLRDVCDVSWMDWCWLDWPQLKKPLSQESKDYILNLDINADAAMLKEQLNFSEKAIDYFRASSKLLQEGTKAGLTLYDIAIMCCRNDDAGEIPSKLEVLTSMASELATSAVRNGRWNHTAASKALADQLSPDGGSLLKCTKGPSKGFVKSVSSINLVSFGADEHGAKSAELPAMTQSTGSDTDTDSVDDDQTADREEWAASVIADVSLDHHQSISMLEAQYRKPRSSSVTSEHSSETTLSSSPKGFWYNRPGSPSPLFQDESDADSFTWSPNLSSTNIAELGKENRISVMTSQDEGEVTILTPTVTFAESLSGGFLLPPATVNVSTFKTSQGGGVFAPVKKSSSMIRSKSYSALSDSRKVYRRSSTISSGDSSRLSDSDKFKRYFNDFVDLVIVRETASLAKA